MNIEIEVKENKEVMEHSFDDYYACVLQLQKDEDHSLMGYKNVLLIYNPTEDRILKIDSTDVNGVWNLIDAEKSDADWDSCCNMHDNWEDFVEDNFTNGKFIKFVSNDDDIKIIV